MKEEKKKRRVYGLSREAEEKQLAEIIDVAQENLERTQKYNVDLEDELKNMQVEFDTRDKEIQALWNNTKSQFQESKQDLMRCLKARNKPYFGRIDFRDPKMKEDESYYIGRVGITKMGDPQPLVIDWRAPLASVYYENTLGTCTYEVKHQGINQIDLKGKRTYEIANDKLIDFFDSDVVANDELLTKYLAKSKKAVLGEIIGTIQKEQNTIIRKSPKTNIIVQGVAGSGKTTVAMHRISYILYNYDNFRPQDFYVIGSNRILLNYITSVLPDLDVYGISQMTMEQLFTRLLYEDWDKAVQKIGVLDKKNLEACIKGSYAWFHDLEKFCEEYERNVIPMEDVVIPKTGVVLVTKERIEAYISERPMYSMQSKINGLTEMLQAKLDNELIGKSVTYSKEEKKELYHESKYHFGKDEWKGSVYDLYQDFLKSQREKGHNIFVTDETYDVYDLAALAFLYKRIKEIDGIREASHIIIDEAQDFGMMAYGCLTYCLRGCTYTIMGDVSQNIHYGYGLNDWEDLKKLILTGSEDSFGLLKKSYRNTVEISNFATEILRHGNFAIYPVEPIIRHGNEVIVSSYENEEKLIEEVANQIQIWQKDGHETIAVICKDEKESRTVSAKLGEIIKLADSNLETAIFEQGVMVLPVEYTKGLEFDAVILYDPSRDKYPEEDQYVKLLYVAATRALHELAVLHLGDLSDLIGKPVSAEKRMSLLKENSEPKKKVQFKKEEYVYSEEKKEDDLERYLQRTRKRYLQPKAEEETQQVAQEELTRKGEQKSKVLKKSETYGETDAATSPHTSTVLKQNNLKQTTSSSEQRISSQESKLSPKRIRESITGDNINPSSYPFNSIVDNTKLTPKGHSRIDCSIRWAKNMKKYFDFASNYGVLRIIPVEDNVIRVQFTRGQEADYDKGYWEYEPTNTVPFSARKSPTQYEVSTGALVIRIDKNTGVLHFFDKKGNLLLEEQAKLPRQIEVGTDGLQSWNYFDWKKNEKLKAKGILEDDLERMNSMARYISFGNKPLRMPLVLSDKGYGLGIAAENTVMFCGIQMYGQYIYTEGMRKIDYYFIYGGDTDKTIELYKKITR